MLGGDAEAEVLERVVEQDLRPEKHLRPLVRRRVAPGGQRRRGRGHGRIDVGLAAHGRKTRHRAGGGVGDFGGAGAFCGNRLAIDPERYGLNLDGLVHFVFSQGV